MGVLARIKRDLLKSIPKDKNKTKENVIPDDRSVDDKKVTKKVIGVEKRVQATIDKISDDDHYCKDNSPSDKVNNDDEDQFNNNDQNIQEEDVSEGDDALSEETLVNQNNEAKERDDSKDIKEKLED